MSLDGKIKRARHALGQTLDRFGSVDVYVAWTGGKDSTVALSLWRDLLQEKGAGPVRALSLDTGLKFQEVTAFRDKWAELWDVDLALLYPAVELEGYPVAEDKLACCGDLKVEPLHRGIRERGARALITGLRRDEHPSRAGREVFERRFDPSYLEVNPILEFTEMDVWAYISGRQLPHCELYAQGYRSLGCKPCTFKSTDAERSGRDAEKEQNLEVLRSLGYF